MYRVTLGIECVEVAERTARALWDQWPESLRSGKRDGAFILWHLDPNGRKTMPTLYRPIPAGPSYL